MIALLSHYMTRWFLFLFCAYITGCATTYHGYVSYAQRPEVRQFIQQMAVKHHFNPQKLTQLFDQVQTNQKILNTMNTPSEGLPWYRYQKLFVTKARAQSGATFWQQHETTLTAAEQRYGVDSAIMLAILGVETNYGHIQGTYPVIDALSTLAFDYPPRANYFRGELEQFLLLTREAPFDPLAVQGSYAGAIGAPQFMPSSYRTYAIDHNSKGYSDLMNNYGDVIYSIANYFKGHGWEAGQPIAVRARVVGQGYLAMLGEKMKSKPFTLAQLQSFGIYPVSAEPKQEKACLLALKGENGPEFWLVFHNFDVILKYNASPRYAMAVYQLGSWIRTIHQKK
jgi:membrane-bound lytic murein transglycosylase B